MDLLTYNSGPRKLECTCFMASSNVVQPYLCFFILTVKRLARTMVIHLFKLLIFYDNYVAVVGNSQQQRGVFRLKFLGIAIIPSLCTWQQAAW